MNDKKLFSDFDSTPAKAFKQKIQYDLKGADYNDTLVWNSPEGIDVKPFYHREETSPIEIPGQPEKWHIGEEIFILDAKASAKTALEVLSKGTETLYFKADRPFDTQALCFALADKDCIAYFNLNFLDLSFLKDLIQHSQNNSLTIYLNIDPIGHLAQEGNWHSSLDEDLKLVDDLLKQTDHPHVLAIDTRLYQNAGAHNTQELAYALGHTVEYFEKFGDQLKNKQITFKVAVGSNYFFEIAKIRALRWLYALIAQEYDLQKTCHILAFPTRRNKTIYDYNNNMLRTTTECMSAVLGGANTVLNMPYDALYHKANEFGQRIARNQLLILKEESYFEEVSNPAQGSYYIENLTQQIAEKALNIFKQLEAGGGFLKQLKEGIIQRKITQSAQEEEKRFLNQEKIILGINKHPNPDDRMKADIELYPFLKMNPRKTLIEPILPRRIAEKSEKQRLEHE